jgi:hypothetical protein
MSTNEFSASDFPIPKITLWFFFGKASEDGGGYSEPKLLQIRGFAALSSVSVALLRISNIRH